jgi:hypothetical protein
MKSKKYTLKTITEITDTVTEKNIDNFIIDFKTFLLLAIQFKKLRLLKDLVKFDASKFEWKDDGKNNIVVNIKKDKK